MDRLSREKRSWNMAQIKGRDTKPEIKVRSLLHSLGFRFRLTNKDLPGKPDIVLPKYRTAIFVHGCFWHRHEGCKYAYTPKSREEFWNEKFTSNIDRDRMVSMQINEHGWKQLIIWECELRDEGSLVAKLKEFLHE